VIDITAAVISAAVKAVVRNSFMSPSNVAKLPQFIASPRVVSSSLKAAKNAQGFSGLISSCGDDKITSLI
jgi:hypothetical protein